MEEYLWEYKISGTSRRNVFGTVGSELRGEILVCNQDNRCRERAVGRSNKES